MADALDPNAMARSTEDLWKDFLPYSLGSVNTNNHVVLTTTDSNLWGGASGHTYTFKRHRNGTTDIDVDVVREGKNLKGRLLGFVLGTIGKSVLEKAFENSVKAIEARNYAATERIAA
jgi:hypothetical protein